MNREEQKVRQLYRESIRQEMKRREIRDEKKQFLAQYFESGKPFYLRPEFAIPAIGLVGLFLIFLLFPRPLGEIVKVAPQERTIVTTEAPETFLYEAYDVKIPSVEVKRVTSRIGPTMVYQKMIQDVPITIVWVFAGEQPL